MSGGGNPVGAVASIFHGVASGGHGGGVLGAMVHAHNVQASVEGQIALNSHGHALQKDMVTHQTDQQIRLSRATTDHKIDLVGAQNSATVSQMRTAGDEHRTSMRTAYSLGAPVAAPAAPRAPRGPQTPQTPSTPSVSAPVVSTPQVSAPATSAPASKPAPKKASGLSPQFSASPVPHQ